ncbi:MFS transporter [Nocardiopsis changdeensis]|uniref:MFS transporter n=1 Tax=Nocardiopsis changdeensis TaxID=2831969 RepID=A0ABX8BMG5_9ACTN|nr:MULTISPECIES: MFS transporter [Nocardiopsis]QUX23434.1 MFS transporter [Nocardiopsis changdeensis]QYX39377.1 MFS transporter [Nocardiopsis sp. MT53]
MRFLLDVTPLREAPPFRRFWIGSSLASLTLQFTMFAATFTLWELTRSTVMVGALGLVGAVAWFVAVPVGMAFIDTVDRARLARAALVAQCAAAVALATAAYLGSAAAVLAMMGLNAVLLAVGRSARQAMVPALVGDRLIAPAIALNGLALQLGMLAGPALAGLLASAAGGEVCFLVNIAGSAASLYGLRGLSVPPAGRSRGFGAMAEGLRYAVRTPPVRGALLTDLAATVLAMPVALFPAINQERFGGDPATLGLFGSAVAVGGVAGLAFSGAVTRYGRPGTAMAVSACVWGLALACAGLSGHLAVLLASLAVAGAADTWSVVSRGTLVQASVPESVRGRVSALEQAVGVAGPDLGNFRAGLVAPLLGAGAAMAVGGLLCAAACAAVYALTPGMRR